MRIVDIRERSVPLRGAISNSVVSFADHTVSLVAVISDVIRDGRPVAGVAFNSIGRFAQSGILRDRMIPRVLAAPPETLLDTDSGRIDPARVLASAMRDEKPGGHGDRAAAAASIELACWDLLAKIDDVPAHAIIADHHGRQPNSAGVPVYAAGGYYRSDGDDRGLVDEVCGYLDAGYQAVKIKIGGAPLDEDRRRIEAVLSVVGDGGRLAVDANGRFDCATALAYGQALEPYRLRWYEEPVDPLDLRSHRELAGAYSGALATGENLFSVGDTVNLLDFGGLRPDRDLLQMDAGLSYGLTEYAAMIDLMEQRGFDRRQAVPHGGHLINLHIVTGMGLGGCEAYPGVFAPFGGYTDDCAVVDGVITPGQRPGFGLEGKPGLDVEIGALLG